MTYAIEVFLQFLGAVTALFSLGFLIGAGATTGIIFARAFWK